MKKLHTVVLGSLVLFIAAGMLLLDLEGCEPEGKKDGVAKEISKPEEISKPDAPKATVTRFGDTQVELTITKPAKDGGSPITRYEIQVTPVPEKDTEIVINGKVKKELNKQDLEKNSVKIKVDGLTALSAGEKYTFTVTATNSAGTSDPSGGVEKKPIAPEAPTIKELSQSTGRPAVDIRIGKPINKDGYRGDGGSPITHYEIQVTPDSEMDPAGGGKQKVGTSIVNGGLKTGVTGLTSGIEYTFTATATNSVGTSAPSEGKKHTP